MIINLRGIKDIFRVLYEITALLVLALKLLEAILYLFISMARIMVEKYGCDPP